MLYQNDTFDDPDGAVNVCVTFESPIVGLALPSNTAWLPECTPVDTIDVVPVRVHPVKSPVSNPPLTIAVGGGVPDGLALGLGDGDIASFGDHWSPATIADGPTESPASSATSLVLNAVPSRFVCGYTFFGSPPEWLL